MEEIATFAGGCFWCTEAIFRRLRGVSSVVSGYTGGTTPNPTYSQVSSGTTGHAEAIQITFDPTAISYEKLVEIFFHLHNPTTKNQQGADRGTQYRSAIYYHSEDQKATAQKVLGLMQSTIYSDKIVTEIEAASPFYPAESYHQEYYEKNSQAPYCQAIIDPKIKKLLAEFSKEVKKEFISATENP